MKGLVLATVWLAVANVGNIQIWMEQAFYPVLLGVLVVASLGLPIPEDIPLIAAGVLLKLHPNIASWQGTLAVAMVGIMSGDLVLYTLGRVWGQGVVNHRMVRRMLTPARFVSFAEKFHQHGIWMVFFGRFVMGVRAAMCLTAGATHYPYWRFFLADFAGALLSIPFFVLLGWWFAGMIPTLRAYLSGVQFLVLGAVIIAVAVAYFMYRTRRRRRVSLLRRMRAQRRAAAGQPAVVTASANAAPVATDVAPVKSKVSA